MWSAFGGFAQLGSASPHTHTQFDARLTHPSPRRAPPKVAANGVTPWRCNPGRCAASPPPTALAWAAAWQHSLQGRGRGRSCTAPRQASHPAGRQMRDTYPGSPEAVFPAVVAWEQQRWGDPLPRDRHQLAPRAPSRMLPSLGWHHDCWALHGQPIQVLQAAGEPAALREQGACEVQSQKVESVCRPPGALPQEAWCMTLKGQATALGQGSLLPEHVE